LTAPDIDSIASPRWLLLAHQLPTRSSNARVKTWRRLQQVGAMPTRNSVYVLPNTEQSREDFEWIRSEIVALGGEATVFAADALHPDGTEAIVALFQKTREADYRALKRECDRMLSSARRKRVSTPSARDTFSRAVRTFRDRLQGIERIDFCHARGRQDATNAIAQLERIMIGRPAEALLRADAALVPDTFRGRRWVTRPRPGVDRMASAWLIRRFIDPHATFAFVDRPAASDVPFDMYDGEFTHHGSQCTFETLMQRFGLDDPALVRLSHIVHDLDIKEARYGLPEAAAVGHLVDGLRQVHADDHALLAQGIAMFEALARSFESAMHVSRIRRPPQRSSKKARPRRSAGQRRTAVPSRKSRAGRRERDQ
jgi:hypothetical protein